MRFRLQPETNFGMIDVATGLPSLTGVNTANFLEVRPDGDESPFSAEALRGESTSRGCSAFSGSEAWDAYTDGSGDEQVLASATWTQSYEYKGPGVGGDVTDLALWVMLRSGMGDGGEAEAGQTEGSDTLTFASSTSATATDPDRWRTGDKAVVIINGEVLPISISKKDGATLTLAIGIGVLPVGAVTAYIARCLFEDPEISELGPSCLWYVDSRCGKFAWAALGVRSKLKGISRQANGRVLLEVEHVAAQVVPRHSDNDNSCADTGCGKGGVAHLSSVKPAFSNSYCGNGGTLAVPFTSTRISGIDLQGDFSMTLDLPSEILRVWSKRIANAEVDFARKGEASVDMVFSSLGGRIGAFDLDPGRQAARPFMMPTKPAGVGTGLVIFIGSTMVDGYTHNATVGAQRSTHEMSFKVAGYHGDFVDGNEAPCANRPICIGFIR